MNRKNNIYKHIGLVSAILLLGIATVSVGVTYGRYQSKMAKSVAFSIRVPATIQITEDSLNAEPAMLASDTVSAGDTGPAYGWTLQADGSYQMTVYINNQNNQGYYPHDIHFSVYLNASLAAGMEGTGVTLIVPNVNGVSQEYVGVKEAFDVNSLLYYEMGEGYQYRFLDGEGEELTWTLSGDGLSELAFTFKLEGVTDSCLVEVVAEEVQAQED